MTDSCFGHRCSLHFAIFSPEVCCGLLARPFPLNLSHAVLPFAIAFADGLHLGNYVKWVLHGVLTELSPEPVGSINLAVEGE